MSTFQLNAEYKSTRCAQDVFSVLIGNVPEKKKYQYKMLGASWVETPLGPMIAVADEIKLYVLEFFDSRGLGKELERLKHKTNSMLIPEITPPIVSIKNELSLYFEGKLQHFMTPLCLLGSEFQKRVWTTLYSIPYGETRSYAEVALAIERPLAYRAAANANGANQIALVIPCHRVITSNGSIGGYAGGIARKEWLIQHEQKNKRTR